MSKTPKPKAFRVRIILKSGHVVKLRLTTLEWSGNTIKWTTPNAALDPHMLYIDAREIATIIRRPVWRP